MGMKVESGDIAYIKKDFEGGWHMGFEMDNIHRPTDAKSEWMPISKLRTINKDISEYGYDKAFIDTHNLNEKKSYHWANGIGQVCFFEALEVMATSGEVFYRENDGFHRKIPKVFETQFGIFTNHNHGEFLSWLGHDGYTGLSEHDRLIHKFYGRDDFFIEGNFEVMFDCGGYSYAISNLMHGGLGWFKIVRIDKMLNTVVLFDTQSEWASIVLSSDGHEEKWTCLEYDGCYPNEEGWCIIASGYRKRRHESEWESEQRCTILFQVDYSGNCHIREEWGFSISKTNSLAVLGDCAYFGQNKMVTRLNLSTGELVFFTNKSDAELAALSRLWCT